MEKIGFVGIGAVGSCMVQRLLAGGATVTVFDAEQKNMSPIVELGANPASSPAEVAAHSTLIITCADNDREVEKVLIGHAGMLDAIQPGSVVVEITTSSPLTTRKIAALLAPKGADIIDASFWGEPSDAAGGTLCFVVGGEENVLTRCRPVLDHLGKKVIHVGELGAGHTVKAINMMMTGANLVAAAEVVGLGAKAGLDRQTMLKVLNVSSGENFITSNLFVKYVLPGNYDAGLTLTEMLQAIRLGTQTARELDIPALLATRAEQILALAERQGLGVEDVTEIVPYIESLMGLHTK